jgi:hypothetical protein
VRSTSLTIVERELIQRERPRADAPFINIHGIIDDAGGAMAFVAVAYARGFSDDPARANSIVVLPRYAPHSPTIR